MALHYHVAISVEGVLRSILNEIILSADLEVNMRPSIDYIVLGHMDADADACINGIYLTSGS
jgi:flavorubredoxin